ncbi:MAG TPA: HPr family phosphocarrier protein, partial [Herpetosiphonaceae bacterium]|nr:HPr family phosphocarrier protein [Herpetosiphonaceae bacterium]
MFELTTETVRLGAAATSKDDAIRQVGWMLIEGGFIEPGYVTSMLGREQQANTFLGNGIAIPHGMGQDRELIRRTGIAVLQLPAGVEWKDGERARLLIGIAARSDEHLTLLANLVDVLGDEAVAERLATTADPAEIIARLTRPRQESAPAADLWRDTPAVEVRIANSAGLHARPATVFVETAAAFGSEIQVQHAGQAANGKALASLLRLGIPHDAQVRIAARGDDAEAALGALAAAVAAGLGDEESHPADDSESFHWQPLSGGRAVLGVAASPGLAIGPLFRYRTERVVVRDVAETPARERERLHGAMATARAQLGDVYESVRERGGRGEAAIFRAHQALLDDPELVAQVEAQIG